MFDFIIQYNLLLLLAVPVYWISWRNLFKMALDSHSAKVDKGDDPNIYPVEYFRWLMIQLIALTTLGLIELDGFIVGTRLLLLVAVAVAFVVVRNDTGKFTWERYGKGLMTWTIGFSILIMLALATEIHEFLLQFDVWFGYVVVVIMTLYLIFGQGATFRKLYRQRKLGMRRSIGLQLQIFRVLGFFLPAIHYGAVSGYLSSLFIINVLGSMGALSLVLMYLVTPKGEGKNKEISY